MWGLNSWPWDQESHALLTELARCPISFLLGLIVEFTTYRTVSLNVEIYNEVLRDEKKIKISITCFKISKPKWSSTISRLEAGREPCVLLIFLFSSSKLLTWRAYRLYDYFKNFMTILNTLVAACLLHCRHFHLDFIVLFQNHTLLLFPFFCC